MTGSVRFLNAKRPLLALSFAIITGAISAWWFFGNHQVACNPKAAEATLANYRDRGIQRTHHPPSLSNLLWITVGPEWHALSKQDKEAIDRIVRCAAMTIDHLGQPNWQAAYYDAESGQLVALTSKKYGFRLKSLSGL